MIFIELPIEFNDIKNIIKYRNVNDDSWYYMYIDIETLSDLIYNFGIISTIKIPTKNSTCDNPSTGNIIKLKYCGADIELICNNKSRFHLPYLDQNY